MNQIETKEALLRALLQDDPAHIYSDEELDTIEEIDPALALRLARVQHIARQAAPANATNVAVDEAAVAAAVTEAQRILAQDGGDIELVGIVDRVVTVRLKGACVGCPNAVLDLRNVVERLIRAKAPGVLTVLNRF